MTLSSTSTSLSIFFFQFCFSFHFCYCYHPFFCHSPSHRFSSLPSALCLPFLFTVVLCESSFRFLYSLLPFDLLFHHSVMSFLMLLVSHVILFLSFCIFVLSSHLWFIFISASVIFPYRSFTVFLLLLSSFQFLTLFLCSPAFLSFSILFDFIHLTPPWCSG